MTHPEQEEWENQNVIEEKLVAARDELGHGADEDTQLEQGGEEENRADPQIDAVGAVEEYEARSGDGKKEEQKGFEGLSTIDANRFQPLHLVGRGDSGRAAEQGRGVESFGIGDEFEGVHGVSQIRKARTRVADALGSTWI